MARGMEKGRAEGMAKGRAEGMAKGRAEGMEKGRAEERAKAESEKLDSALQLLGMGLPAAQVALVMNLPLDTVKALVK